ncbi:hypothetical protein BJ138DRAFT_63535 [Hygrophoropsis aurantiaca]|uniref:Uncharacterized protein n=1 Tax=Hygrophoropsis aurantiaca TaxID=72124 RepID=A0ACB8ABH6_9AGAM|nr:hypothetical protein BJ138DRAFT_63535 [Hygrophoropsis aurantiaca]
MGNLTVDQVTNIRITIKIIEDEVLELEIRERELLERLHLLQDSIACKRALVENLKNSFVPVNRLPNEILLTCFGQAVQDWLEENDGVDESVIVDQIYDDSEAREAEVSDLESDFEWPRSPAFTISHVSHHWRELAIHTPSLWTNLIITPAFERHLDVFRDFLYRVHNLPISANFRSFGWDGSLSSNGVLLMEAIMPLILAQQITALTLLNSGPVLSSLLSQLVEQPVDVRGLASPSVAFSRLSVLCIFRLKAFHDPKKLSFTHLRRLLSATPQLQTLELQICASVTHEEDADKTAISLPMLENLTVVEYNPFLRKFLASLYAPEVRQLKLLRWNMEEDDPSYLFAHNDGFLKVPRLPKVWNLTLSFYSDDDALDAKIISAFPRVTHFTLHNPCLEKMPGSPPPTFQCLQHLTMDYAFVNVYSNLRSCFTWLPAPADQATPLQICIFDSSDLMLAKEEKLKDTHLFRHYKELQRYGKLDRSSIGLDEFVRWQADGEPEI